MMRARARRGFTLLELLVVIAIIALLISILMPSLSRAREQGRQVYCLANLRSIGQGAIAYAYDIPQELIIPIHRSMVTLQPAGDWWLTRCAMWFSFGGRSAPQPFMTDQGPQNLGEGTPWAANTRPLNLYLYGSVGTADAAEMKLFHCPSDRGYPDHPDIDDSPPENAGRSCYDTLGSSYRASLHAILSPRGTPYDGAFAIGPWGHRLSTLTQPAEVPAFGEPTFFNMIGMDNGVLEPAPVIAMGWHRRRMVDNLVFCDGSAHPTQATARETVSAESCAKMGIAPENSGFIARGKGWKLDAWPTPGARIWAADPTDPRWNAPFTGQTGLDPTSWPFRGAQENLR